MHKVHKDIFALALRPYFVTFAVLKSFAKKTASIYKILKQKTTNNQRMAHSKFFLQTMYFPTESQSISQVP